MRPLNAMGRHSADPGVPERQCPFRWLRRKLQPKHARHAAVHAEMDELVEIGTGVCPRGRVEERQVDDGEDESAGERVPRDVVRIFFILEHVADAFDTGDQRVYFLFCIVEGEGGADGASMLRCASAARRIDARCGGDAQPSNACPCRNGEWPD
jgi:hypothetical protein